jgi:hypothetical protein
LHVSETTVHTRLRHEEKKARNTLLLHDLKHAEQFSLVDAMQYASAISPCSMC